MKKIAISGIMGRMGDYVYKVLENRQGFSVVSGISKTKNKFTNIRIFNDINELKKVQNIDILVDFTHGNDAVEIIKTALNSNIKVISGTTGIDDIKLKYLSDLSEKNRVSFIHIPNFAKGSSDMYNLVKNLVGEYERADIVEVHHKEKLDKPSGTAKEYAKAMKIDYNNIESVRLNDVIASHEIIFSNSGEKLIIRHEINHRDAFLKGFTRMLDYISKPNYVKVIGLEEFYKTK